MKELEEIFSKLGLSKDNGLFLTKEEYWKTHTSFPNRVKRLIEQKIKPDAFFCFDNKPLIFFFSNPIKKKELHEAIWNFNECPIAIIIDKNIVEIFNGFNYLRNERLLEKLGGIEKLSDFAYFELVTGKTWEQYKDQLDYKNRVDFHLLQNIKAARKVLVEQHKLSSKISNSIIGKCIFVRYLIDRKVKMKFDNKLRTWSNDEFCNLLTRPNEIIEFFNYLEDNERGFNGDLFPLNSDEYGEVSEEDYLVIKRLLQGDDIEKNQPSLFEFYDFSIIPIEFISNVYELFIGQENQKQEGAYYTPLFLVDYILKETVENHLNGSRRNLSPKNDSYTYCKVLDPACGSGIFLVETLRKIIEKYVNDTTVIVKSESFKTALKNLATQNIYGIDKDLSAVQVAIFSIYLTLLDYLDPPDIETFKFPVLFNTNFFQADFFDIETAFNSKLNEIEFDFVLGNPPWKGNGMDEIGNSYLRHRKKKEVKKKFKIAINNNEIAEGFVLRASDFCKKHTRVAFIIRSSSLYNLGYDNDEYSPFRQYLLEEFFIDKVFELAPVRREVFEKSNKPAIAPAAVLFYRFANGLPTDDNQVEHISLKKSRFFSLFKIFTINRTDYKLVKQARLKEFDWLWKVLVYGSYLDFNFIKRLKEEYPSIKKIISNEDYFVDGTGIQYSANPTYNAKHLINKPFIDSRGVTSFFIIPEKISLFKQAKVHRLRDERLFKAPMLLIREGIDLDTLTAKCAISKKDVVFKGSITSIKAINSSNNDSLNNILALFNSFLFSYYSINLFTTIGIERERVTNYNKYSLPYLVLDLSETIKSIEQLYQTIHSEGKKPFVDERKTQELNVSVQNELAKINTRIYQKLNLNDIELTLLDYCLEINRNLITGNDFQRNRLFTPLGINDGTLKNYATLFIDRFKSKLDSPSKKFIVEIWHTSQIVGIFFKMIPTNEYKQEIFWINKQSSAVFLSFLTKIGSEKITDRLFAQKDIRGFEKDYFYIIKPNERRLWHKAIGYLDVNEFADSILKTGRKEE